MDNNIHVDHDQHLLTSLTKACKLANDMVKHRFPISKSLLMLILWQVGHHFAEQPYLAITYKTILSTAYFGMFRIGELTATISKHAVLAKDVHIAINKRKILLLLHSLKTHGPNCKPQKIKITSTPTGNEKQVKLNDQIFCPYMLLRNYLSARCGYHGSEENFFIFRDKTVVSAQNVQSLLKLILKKAGFDHRLYDTHSLRAGKSLDLLKAGVSVETIKQLGHWKSNTVFTYLKS